MTSVSSIPKPHFHVRSVSLPFVSSQISEFDGIKATTSSSSICQKDVVNEMLDELLRLLDLCSTAKDALLMTMDSAQQLQSVLRRKRGDSNGISSAIQEYQSNRKAVKKVILKALRQLNGTTSIKKKQKAPLKEVESITLKILNKWSFVSKLMGQKHVARDESSGISPVEKVDGVDRKLLQLTSSYCAEGACIFRNVPPRFSRR